jgi:hypothetical protein
VTILARLALGLFVFACYAALLGLLIACVLCGLPLLVRWLRRRRIARHARGIRSDVSEPWQDEACSMTVPSDTDLLADLDAEMDRYLKESK